MPTRKLLLVPSSVPVSGSSPAVGRPAHQTATPAVAGAPDDCPSSQAGPTGPAVLSVADVAVLLGVSEWLVLQQVRRGGLPHRRVGRRILFSRSRLLTWLADDPDAEHPGESLASRRAD